MKTDRQTERQRKRNQTKEDRQTKETLTEEVERFHHHYISICDVANAEEN